MSSQAATDEQRKPTAVAQTLMTQLGYVQMVLEKNTADLTHEDSLIQPASGGNCLNWVLGHMLATRNRMLAMVGRDPVWDEATAARYERYSEPISGPGEGVLPLAKLLADFAASQESLLEGLSSLTPEDLAVRIPWFEGETDKASALAGFLFHESYHLGQTGLHRRAAGKKSTL